MKNDNSTIRCALAIALTLALSTNIAHAGGGAGYGGASGGTAGNNGTNGYKYSGGGGGGGNNGTNAPGSGGAGGDGGGGGGGNYGATYNTTSTITIAITGNVGDYGDPDGGGDAVVFTGTGTLITSNTNTGGGGGAGRSHDGSGGGGGGGIVFTGAGSLINNTSGTIKGGDGGNGITGSGGGGGGGAGVIFTVAGSSTLTNAGSIDGGAGGWGGGGGGGAGAGAGGGGAGWGGAGWGGAGWGGAGAGIVGAPAGGFTVINAGSIGGANAIIFFGSGNSLELQSGYSFTGNVVNDATGSNNTLIFGGDTSPTADFDLSQIGDTDKYQHFTALSKTGTSTWTLTGSLTTALPLNITTGALTLDGAKLTSDVTGDAATGVVTLTLNNSTLTGTVDPTDMTIDASSTWNMTGNSTVATLTNNGNIVSTDLAANSKLTVTNYNGTGTIKLNAVLGNTSTVDTLNITGTQTGTINLAINNLGGTGAQTTGNGILIATTTGTVSLTPFTVGKFKYSLQQVANKVYLVSASSSLSDSVAIPSLTNFMLLLTSLVLIIAIPLSNKRFINRFTKA